MNHLLRRANKGSKQTGDASNGKGVGPETTTCSTFFKTGQASVVGTKYGDLNQDACIIKHVYPGNLSKEADGGIVVALVLDGHGMLGEVAASAAGEVISKHVEKGIMDVGESCLKDIGSRKIKDIILEAFEKAHAYVLSLYDAAPPEYHFPCGQAGRCTFRLEKQKTSMIYSNSFAGDRLIEFGTTVSLVIADREQLVVGHVGDSDVVVGALESGFAVATEVTDRHSGANIREQFRIGQFLGENEALFDCANLRDDGYLEVTNLGGSNSSVALGMTRAVGHYHLENYGVISRPEIRFYDFQKDDLCVILATDGVWDAMHPRDAVHFVCENTISMGRSEQKTAMDLCEKCVELQLRTHGGADNTTAVVICLPFAQADSGTTQLVDQDETIYMI